MAQQVVNVGTQANDATGDLLRDAFTKINTNFAALFAGNFPAAQLTVGPPVSGNALTAVGISGSAAIVATAFSVTDISLTASGTASFAGGVTFGSPTGGNKGAGSFNAASGFINNAAVLTVAVTSIAGTVNQITASASTGSVTLSMPQNVVIPTPSSGVALAVVAASGGTAISIQTSAASSSALTFAAASQTGFTVGMGINGSSNWVIRDTSNSADRISLTSSGNISFPAPSSGDNLLLTNVAGGNALTVVGNSAGTAVLRLNTQATTGAQAVTLAITNKPGASGQTTPAKWVPINLDGTTHYVPAFL